MQKIGIISDTHVGYRIKALPSEIFEIFKDVDLIIHAGDFTEPRIIDELKAVAPLVAVRGNNDGFEIAKQCKSKEITKIGGKTFLIIHELSNISDELTKYNIDCVIFGHTHKAKCYMSNNILYFNPGSPTDKRAEAHYSVGIIEVDENIKGEIIYFDRENCFKM